MNSIRLLIVDDNFIARRGLRSFLETQPDMFVAGEASTGFEALDMARTTNVDVVLLDIKMPRMDGITATRELLKICPECKLLILTVLDEPSFLAKALLAGAVGYLIYGRFTPEDLVRSIRKVKIGETAFIPAVPPLLLRILKKIPEPSGSYENSNALTSRELEILKYIVLGDNNLEIAKELAIEEKTVKNHINNIYSKLGVTSRQDAVWLVTGKTTT